MKSCKFGSFQTVQRRTYGYFFAAAYANDASAVALRG
jgi:hypothetical protein